MPIPSNVSTVTVTGSFVDADGVAAQGKIVFTPSNVVSDASSVPPTIILDGPIEVKLVNGAFSQVLPATDDPDLAPVNFTYSVQERIAGHTVWRSYSVSLPAATPTVDLASLAPVSPVDEVSAFARLATDNVFTEDMTVGLGTGGVSRSITLGSSYAGGQDTTANAERFDSTGRVNFYMYQQAFRDSYGEPVRIHMRKRDAKGMLTWKGPTSFTAWDNPAAEDPVGGDPVGNDKNWAWIGAHYESNDHNSIHGHLSVETPDAANGFLQTRLEFLLFDTRNSPPTFGLDTTLIATNQANFVIRASGATQFLRFSGASLSQRGMEFTREVWGAERLWKIISDDSPLTTDGSNSGGNIEFRRYSDTNVQIDTPLRLSRANGTVEMAKRLGVGQAPDATAIVGVTSAVDGNSLYLTNTLAGGNTNQPHIRADSATATSLLWASRVTGDLISRFLSRVDGQMQWGDGTNARDTNLYRSAADTLKTDDNLHVGATLRHLGTTLGFYNAAAVAKPTVTGSRGGNAALASLLTSLASQGLITDSSTA